MFEPPTPHDDDERIAALQRYAVLDTPEESQFDRITRIAAELFDVTTSLVSLIDKNRQWFKSHHGLEERETPRSISFCAHAVAQRAPLIVLDTHHDERFADNPLVLQNPNIRFYAGALLITPDDFILGTLCLIDNRPRSGFSAGELVRLQDLADVVMDILELRRQSNRLAIEAYYDNLTRLPNRALLADRFRQAMGQAERRGHCMALFVIDLDNFKAINDTQGHQVGDRHLRTAANRLKLAMRSMDSVARWGGDEFVGILALREESELGDVMARIGEALMGPKRKPTIEASIGVSIFPRHGHSIDELLAAADAAMYRVKGRQEPCYAVAGEAHLRPLFKNIL